MRKVILLFISIFAATSIFSQEAAVWSFEQKDNGDGTIDLIFKADIQHPWYMYNTTQFENGPLPTNFEINQGAEFESVGKLNDILTPRPKYDDAFGMDVLVFEKEAAFSYTIKRLTNEPFKVEGILIFQTCNGSECLMDEIDVSFSIPAGTIDQEGIRTIKNDIPKENSTSGQSENKANQGLFTFLLIAFAAGLGGVFTPCVFPMIPMTVSFFIGGNGKKRDGIIKGLVFGISVTLIYTLVGVIVALFQSTDATDAMGTHWIPNLLFAVLFMIFAISFFGAFEITLPTGLANKADAKADKGGFIASFFVAFAMVIVSFSCTGPFVGSILAAAVTGGLAIKPILGMAAFGLAFSLPFVIFSFFPSLMKKMPKSGGWLNIVKVVFAFILLGFSLKFLSTVDAYFGWGILTRALFISIWIAISILLGIYLLGKLKTSHDSDTPFVGTFRILLAIASFSFAIYLVPGLFGAPLASLSGLIPPQDGSTIVLGSSTVSSNGSASINEPSKGLCGQARYATVKNRAPHGLPSYYTVEDAIECAKETRKPILLSFKAQTCSVCKVMEATVWSKPEVLEIIREKYVLASLYVDDRTELPQNEQVVSQIDGKLKNTLGRKLRDYQLSRFGVASQPYYVLIDSNQNVLTEPVGESSVEEFMSFLNSGIEAFEKAQ
ncbi:MAG: cytochrome c biogenesis protein CcdA [Bacteroidales bacterium]|nr:cytochrome c biogenesis protein CcdA [Bacteroidales bacterium]MDD3299664.1 cytochrome c biogenesis protein CcdA [Bacteroidales bacterium]MDD3843612.1 cytochrome c biogenesis protein CcdA [Bacteroidales bacterium]MDD4618514.1 cytochrome c biogenesis protein CcdA [Bacteroidales bacterium]